MSHTPPSAISQPSVSVIVPCRNEAGTIRGLLEAIAQQTYPRRLLSVVIADGQSTDGTQAQIVAFQKAVPDLPVLVIENSAHTIPAGLNAALAAAQGEVIVRLDAHSAPRRDYVERCVAALVQGKGVNVGGVWDIRPRNLTWQARAIAAAAAHPLGVGDAHYRHATHAQVVDTVPFGAFRRALIDRIGAFDETLLTNEDYEFNVRVRQSGGVIWLDPAIRSIYYARPDLTALWQQYWRYGTWKQRMLRRYPDTLRWRQALPPLFVAFIILFGLAAPLSAMIAQLWLAGFGIYLLVIGAAGLVRAMQLRDAAMLWGLPLAIACMHFAWGGGFLVSLFTSLWEDLRRRGAAQ